MFEGRCLCYGWSSKKTSEEDGFWGVVRDICRVAGRSMGRRWLRSGEFYTFEKFAKFH